MTSGLSIFRRCNIGLRDITYNGMYMEVTMKLTTRLQRLNLAMTVVALLGGGLLLSACGTIAGAGQDVSNIGYSVSSGANQVQRQTNAP